MAGLEEGDGGLGAVHVSGAAERDLSAPETVDPRVDDDQADHGRRATTPGDIPVSGWRDVLVRVKSEAKADNAAMLAAGVAFFGLLALVPALVALVSLYGLVADPATIGHQVGDALSAAPREVRALVQEQLTAIADGSGGGALLGVVIGLALALWSASSGTAHLVEAINLAYDERETRSFIKRRGLSLALTIGAVIFVAVALATITVVPALLQRLELGFVGGFLANAGRWVGLAASMMVALGVLYRVAPDRDAPQWRWASPGAVVATLVWLSASALFSVYTANFASYNETYGALGAIVVVMLWLLLSAAVVILGGELNCELERQTVADTTIGRQRPMGRRGAYAADTVAPSNDAHDGHDQRR